MKKFLLSLLVCLNVGGMQAQVAFNDQTMRMFQDIVYFRTHYDWLYGKMFTGESEGTFFDVYSAEVSAATLKCELKGLICCNADGTSNGVADLSLIPNVAANTLTLRIKFSNGSQPKEIVYSSRKNIVLGFYNQKEFSLASVNDNTKVCEWLSATAPDDAHPLGALLVQRMNGDNKMDEIKWFLLVNEEQHAEMKNFLLDVIPDRFNDYTPTAEERGGH